MTTFWFLSIAAWLALYCSCISFANSRASDDAKQVCLLFKNTSVINVDNHARVQSEKLYTDMNFKRRKNTQKWTCKQHHTTWHFHTWQLCLFQIPLLSIFSCLKSDFFLFLHSCILKYIIMSHSHEFSMTDDWNKKKLLLFVQVLSSFMLSLSAVVMSYMQSPTSLMSQISLWDYLQNLINEWNKNNKITVIACIYLHI